jgi:hypothetical protein
MPHGCIMRDLHLALSLLQRHQSRLVCPLILLFCSM